MIYNHGNASQMGMDISTGYQMQMRPRKIELKAKHNTAWLSLKSSEIINNGYEAQGHEQ